MTGHIEFSANAAFLHCRKMGVTHYDLAGVDDVNVPGVASFKRRTGAQRVEWLDDSVYLTGWAEVLFDGDWLRQIIRTA